MTVTDTTGYCIEDQTATAPAMAAAAGPGSADGLGQKWSGYRLQDGARWAVSVTNSSDLAQALQNGQVENIAIADPLDPV